MSPIRLGRFWFPLSFNTFSMGEVSYTDQKSHNIREKNRDHICLLTLSQMLPFHPFPAVLWTTSLHWGVWAQYILCISAKFVSNKRYLLDRARFCHSAVQKDV